MNIFLDTSVMVAGLVTAHPYHNRAIGILRAIINGEHKLIISAHSLAETYVVLPNLPLKPKIVPSIAWTLIEENIIKHAKIIDLSTNDYLDTLRANSSTGITGKVVYDSLIAKAASTTTSVDRIYTFNEKDFIRVWTGNPDLICVP